MAKHDDQDHRTLFSRADTRNPTPVRLREQTSAFWPVIIVMLLITGGFMTWFYWGILR